MVTYNCNSDLSLVEGELAEKCHPKPAELLMHEVDLVIALVHSGP